MGDFPFNYKCLLEKVTSQFSELHLCLLFLKNNLKIVCQRGIFWDDIFCSPSLSETDKQNALLLSCSFLYLKHLFRSNPNQDNLYLRIIKEKKKSWLLRQFALNFPAVRVGRVNVFQLRGGAVTFWQSHMQMLLY